MNFLSGAPGIDQLVKRTATNGYSGTVNPGPGNIIMGDKDMGSVVVGDLCLCMASAAITNGAGGAGFADMGISNATGTATVVYGVAASSITWAPPQLLASETVQLPWFSWGRCTVAGTWIPRFVGTATVSFTSFSAQATLYVLRGV